MVLILDLEIDEYTKQIDRSQSFTYKQIVDAFFEVNLYIRFIATRLYEGTDLSVESPAEHMHTSETVRKALNDCDLLLAQHGPLDIPLVVEQ